MPEEFEVICIDRSRCAYDVWFTTDNMSYAYMVMNKLVFRGILLNYDEIYICRKLRSGKLSCSFGSIRWKGGAVNHEQVESV